MEAVRVHAFGGIDQLVLEDVPIPEPQAGEALVRVYAAGVGSWDALVRSGHSSVTQALPLTPGSDIAGVIERVGDGSGPGGVGRGDAIFGVTNPSFTGGYAQYARARLDSIARKPPSLDFIKAASVPVVAVTAWQMLFDYAFVTAGQRVLVLGAAGNVGAYAMQLARWAGASPIPYMSGSTLGGVKDVDAAIDTIGGEVAQRALASVKRGGTFVSSVSLLPQAHVDELGVRVAFLIVRVTRETLEKIANLFDEGKLAVNVGTVLTLAEAQTAHRMLAGEVPHAPGKIVIKIADAE